MKRTIQKLLVLTIILFVCLFIYIRLGACVLFDSKDRTSIIMTIKQAPKLPERFYELYEVAYPRSLNTGLTENIFQEFLDEVLKGRKRAQREIPSSNAVYLSTNYYGVKRAQVIYYIEDHLSQKECLDYIASNIDFMYKNTGVEQASQYHFKKPLIDLSDKEMMTLIIMMKNPSLYNSIRRPETVENAVNSIMKKLEDTTKKEPHQ